MPLYVEIPESLLVGAQCVETEKGRCRKAMTAASENSKKRSNVEGKSKKKYLAD